MMTIADFFYNHSETYIPKTPSAAIMAYETGILPIEYFIYKCSSALALDEEHIDLMEIERIIAMPDLDINANSLLITILERLINDPDPEIALFAAESINLIESRYNEKIEELKEQLKQGSNAQTQVCLARLYYELGVINYKKETIKTFYYKEAYHNMKDAILTEKIELADVEMLITVMIGLKQYENAIAILEHLNKDNNIFLLALTAQVEFERKNYIKVYNLLSGIFTHKEELTAKLGNICSYWMDKPWIERSEFV